MEDIQKILEQLEAAKEAGTVTDYQQARALEAAICHYRKLAEDEKKTVLSVNFNVVVTGEDIDDIMCSALEGGINYWCDKAEVDGKYRGEYASEQISRGGTLILHDTEEDRQYVLTKANFRAGLERYLKRPAAGDFIECVDHELRIDTGYVDAPAADCIIQYALFGDVIYG